MALHDPDTQLPTEALFRDRLEQAVHLAKRRQGSVGLIAFPLLGEPVETAEMRTLAEQIGARLRASDTTTHLDGCGFLVLLSEVEDRAAAWAVAEELLLTVRHRSDSGDVPSHPVLSDDYTLAVFPDDGDNAVELWRRVQGEV